jgi:hypothetical protein
MLKFFPATGQHYYDCITRQEVAGPNTKITRVIGSKHQNHPLNSTVLLGTVLKKIKVFGFGGPRLKGLRSWPRSSKGKAVSKV